MSRQGKLRSPTPENIKAFWDEEASELGGTPQVTIRDHYFRLHELHTLLPLIPRGSRLLDVGCGTGFGTTVLASRADYALGLDYSDKMVEWAKRLVDDQGYRKELSKQYAMLWSIPELNETGIEIEFDKGDVLNLNLRVDDAFDVITGQRLLINLPSHDQQMQALRELRRHIRASGKLILVEATTQGHERTDKYRSQFGLPILEKYWHNHYVDEARFNDWISAGWRVECNLGFETYALLSKVVYPAACGQANCSFLSGANAAAMETACLFRSEGSVQEIGTDQMLNIYVENVKQYEVAIGETIEKWLAKTFQSPPPWKQLGHQRLFIARPI